MFIIYFKITGGHMWHIQGPWPTRDKAQDFIDRQTNKPDNRWRDARVRFCDPD